MIIISTSQTVLGQPSPRFHIEAWLPFRNCEMDYLLIEKPVLPSHTLNNMNSSIKKIWLKVKTH